jgi:excinuclease ABC subunit A
MRAPKRDGRASKTIGVTDARGHNLAGVDFEVPVGRMTVVAGVSGSGKSTLVRQVFYPAVRRALGLEAPPPLPFGKVVGHRHVARALSVDQSPIGKSPRSTPATFLGIWDHIRKLYAAAPEAQVRGFSASRFSYNTKGGGRCPTCEGAGIIVSEMSFLPDVSTPCESCGGLRFDPATLEIRWLGTRARRTSRRTRRSRARSRSSTISASATCSSDKGVTRSRAARRSG